MAEQRFSLEDAGKLLGGLHPNTVRARAAKGKIPYEKDNTGKWFVLLDPAEIANQSKGKPPKSPTKEPPLEPSFVSAIKALEATIVGLNEELKTVRGERDSLRVRLDEKAEVAARLEAAMAALSAKSDAAAAEVEALRARLERETDENRKQLVGMLEQMARSREPEPVARPSLWRRLVGAR